MLKGLIIAQVVVLFLTTATIVAAQESCEDSIAITGLELRLNAAKALHKGCMVREEILFDRDPEAYINAYGTNFNACQNRFLSRINCNDKGEQLCAAIRDYESAVQQCRQAQNSENDLAEDAAEELNERRREDGGANTLSKELTEDALERLNTETGSALNSFSDAANSVSENASALPSASGGQDAPSSSVQVGLGTELSPEFQAILDGSVEALRQANRDNDLSIDEAQQILNNGLQQIEEQNQRDIDQARDEIFGNQTGSADTLDLETRMRQQFSEFQPPQQSVVNSPRSEGTSGRHTLQANLIRACMAPCQRQQAIMPYPDGPNYCSSCCRRFAVEKYHSCFTNQRTFYEQGRWP